MTVLFPNNQVRIERLCPRWPRRWATYSRTAPHSDLDCRIQNREPLRASRESETTGNPSLHQSRRSRGSRTCWLCSGHLTVWRIARTDYIRLPKLPKGRRARSSIFSRNPATMVTALRTQNLLQFIPKSTQISADASLGADFEKSSTD
jgi:hypothetical protein